jgi:hypothetical protein
MYVATFCGLHTAQITLIWQYNRKKTESLKNAKNDKIENAADLV